MSADQKAKLKQKLAEAQARLEAFEAKENKQKKARETKGALLWGRLAASKFPDLLDSEIARLSSMTLTPRQSFDLSCLRALREMNKAATQDDDGGQS